MPSWNIHTAHVEALLAEVPAADLGVGDENVFLFGNYVPDVYVGYMVPAASMRIDYRITHFARGDKIPVPAADRFWDSYLPGWNDRPRVSGPSRDLVLGAWYHLACDRAYNAAFRRYYQQGCPLPFGDELRAKKQGDFALFGHSLRIARLVEATPALLDACRDFGPFRILADDVRLSCDAANHIVATNADESPDVPGIAPATSYQLLSAAWMADVFAGATAFARAWLTAAAGLIAEDAPVTSQAVRERAALGPAEPDDPDWVSHIRATI